MFKNHFREVKQRVQINKSVKIKFKIVNFNVLQFWYSFLIKNYKTFLKLYTPTYIHIFSI